MPQWVRRAGIGLLALSGLLGIVVAWEWKAALPLETLKARWAGPPSRFVDVDGMSVHYRDEGSGPTIVLLHGTGASLHTWDAWTEVLSRSHRVVRLDLPAFGLTGPRVRPGAPRRLPGPRRRGRYRECLEGLDAARAIDEAGDREAEVRALREMAVRGVREFTEDGKPRGPRQ